MLAWRALMRWTVCALLVLAGTLVPSSFGALSSAVGPRGAYALGTVLMLLLTAPMTVAWPRTISPAGIRHMRYWRAAIAGLAGVTLLARVASQLLPAVFAGPLDPNRGDMLVIIEHAITAFLNGGNPYAIHHVPWDAPLSYGPILWLPFVVPHLLRFDLRILTLAAQLVVPALAFLVAGWRAGLGNVPRAIVLFALGAALAMNPDIMRFHAIGQTQVYWPLLLMFCGLLAAAQWTAAAVCLGLLVAARTTMVAIVPVFFIHLAVNRLLSFRRIAAFTLACTLPFVPFVIVDPASVWYAMFGVYMKVMKTYVWHSTTWAVDTYGITGRLLERGLERYVEIVQVTVLAATYALAWRALRRGGRPEPWMGLALLMFSMTTLWPVIYLYFDVWIFMTCALVARDGYAVSASGRTGPAEAGHYDEKPPFSIPNNKSLRDSAAPSWNVARAVPAVSLLSLGIVLGAASLRPGSRYSLDIGDPAVSGYTGGGFGRDEPILDEGRTAVWIEGETARVRLPRAGWSGATIRLAIRPNPLDANTSQRVAASLNDRAIGVRQLADGWQEITFETRARDWNYGFNLLDLHFSYAVPPSPATGDRRLLSAAIDRIEVQ